MAHQDKLLTPDFMALNGIMFLVYCNVAVFFQFHRYLERLGISAQWSGLIIAIYALAALILRPFLSSLLNPHNAVRWMRLAVLGVMLCLVAYYPAQSVWSLLLVRVLHGAVFVVLGTAATARLVSCIPPAHSGQAFGILAVIVLLPYAVMPPLIEWLEEVLGGFVHVLLVTALLMLPVFPLLARLGPVRGQASDHRLTWAEFKANLQNRQVVAMLLAALLLYSAFGPVFYYLKGFGDKLGIANPGWFLTVSTCTEIAVRLVAGPLLDRGSKRLWLALALAFLAVGYGLLAAESGASFFLVLAVWFGLAWGVAMPMVNALIFQLSPPKLRPLNTNLGMQMFQGGLFIGPLAGGWLLSGGGYGWLWGVCGFLCLASLAVVPLTRSPASASND